MIRSLPLLVLVALAGQGCASGELENRLHRFIGWFDLESSAVDSPDVRDVWRSGFADAHGHGTRQPLDATAAESRAWRDDPETSERVEAKLRALEAPLVRYAEATGQPHPGETGLRFHVLAAMDGVAGIAEIDADPYYESLSHPLAWYYVDELTVIAEQLEGDRRRARLGPGDAAIEWTALVTWFRGAFEAELAAEQARVAALAAEADSAPAE